MNLPTYVQYFGDEPVIVVITRELDSQRVEYMWVLSYGGTRNGTFDWSFRRSFEDPKNSWTRVA